MSHQPLKRADWLVGAGAALASLAAYARTLVPGLLYGDSAEFQTLSALPGMTHPTGYPVYLLAGWIFARLPFGDPAYNLNLMSAVFGAITVGLAYLIGVILTHNRWTPLAGAAALAVSYTFWTQAIIAELYTAASALMMGVILLILLWDRLGSPRYLFFAGLLGGISPAAHLSVALMAPAALVFLVVKRANPRSWDRALLGISTGLLLWLVSFVLLDSIESPTSYYNAVMRPSLSEWELTEADFDTLPKRFPRIIVGSSMGALLASEMLARRVQRRLAAE